MPAPAEEKFSIEELNRIYTDHKKLLEDELLNTEKVLKLLSDVPRGVRVDIPRPTFFAEGNGKLENVRPSTDDRDRGNWATDVMTVIRAAPENAPLLTTAQIIKGVIVNLKRSVDTKERGNISSSIGGLRKRGAIGFIKNEITGDWIHGDLKYFRDGGTTLKPKYLPLMTKVDGDEPPEHPEAKVSTPRVLSEDEIAYWQWGPAITDFLDVYDPETDGLLTAGQIAEKIMAQNIGLDMDPRKESGLVSSHLKLMWDKNKVGRTKNLKGKILIWGHIKYFEDRETLKKKYEHFAAV